MKRIEAAVLCLALAAACAPKPSRTFRVAVNAPLTSRDTAAALAAGLEVVDSPPDGAALAPAGEGEAIAPWGRLRLLGARAAAEGRAGVVYGLPAAPEGRALVDYPEEWQALSRTARELNTMRPVIEGGVEGPSPAEGVEGRRWSYRGRDYAVLVNASTAPVSVDGAAVAGYRALFEARSSPGEALSACPAGRCLGAGQVLWLEGGYW